MDLWIANIIANIILGGIIFVGLIFLGGIIKMELEKIADAINKQK
jgi:hypothetical protein